MEEGGGGGGKREVGRAGVAYGCVSLGHEPGCGARLGDVSHSTYKFLAKYFIYLLLSNAQIIITNTTANTKRNMNVNVNMNTIIFIQIAAD